VNQKNLIIPELGKIILKKSSRARRLNITIKANQVIYVTMPLRVSEKHAIQFVSKKQNWIHKHMNRLKYLEKTKEQINLQTPTDYAIAKEYLIQRLNYLALRYDFNYNHVTIRRQKTRWGSCSTKNNISLNLKIFLLPPQLQDYILLHELVHTRHKHHQSAFWNELLKYSPNARMLQKRLHDYNYLQL
jgi:predicted metal-dependent hydrolase